MRDARINNGGALHDVNVQRRTQGGQAPQRHQRQLDRGDFHGLYVQFPVRVHWLIRMVLLDGVVQSQLPSSMNAV